MENAENSKGKPVVPAVTLPRGGGAIRGVGEKFAANPVTGTGSTSVPIITSPGRSGFGPQLSLAYDSGSGNGPFGFGWSLSLPTITRKTDKGLPRYDDAAESDVFVLSGAEDLVPVSDVQAPPAPDGYQIQRYRPRVEGLFARIERWTDQRTGATHWRSISRDNITTFYGRTPESRIADPADARRIFSWLICESFDDRGNAIAYGYQPDHVAGVPAANRYLKTIRYGNRTPRRPDDPPDVDRGWMFEVAFEYDGDRERLDPFSSYRAGFEVRTRRLCRRVAMVHHFPQELQTADYLVRATDFAYREDPIATFLMSVTQSGYVRADGGYTKQSLPPLEFEYSRAVIQPNVIDVDAESLENLPHGFAAPAADWVDLDGEGMAGVLTEAGGAWFYKRNLSDRAVDFAPLEQLPAFPAASPSTAALQFLDLAADGQLDVVQLEGRVAGYFERTRDKGWEPLVPFVSLPNIVWSDPNLRFVDLTGDGHADVLITEDNVFTWYPSLGESGFGRAERVPQAADEERGPRLVFADATQSVHLADMSGDGLIDLVRIRNGEVSYWPNLGYGRFGAKVTMTAAPVFDYPDHFDQARIRLADIDGSGVTDIIYLADDGVDVYFNESGNGWTGARRLTDFPRVDHLASVAAVDLLGNGTACLVWSSLSPVDAGRPLRYIDLMGGQKPHLLVKTRNNLGAETVVQYAPSTKFYRADERSGRRWTTHLPFPVHVVERVETYDTVSQNRFVTRYAYHDGHFDGDEREFRGFGLVEQWDTEEYNFDEASRVPPVLTRTWFHTGGDLSPELRDDAILPVGLTAEETREAHRALKGSMLRHEVYARDGSPQEPHPYTVSERSYTVTCLQRREDRRHAVFFVHPRETLDYQYERRPEDPRVSHALTLAVDDFGNVLKSAAIAYGRRLRDERLTPADQEIQARTFITQTENTFTNAVLDQENDYRTPLPSETRTYQLTGLVPSSGAWRYAPADLTAAMPEIDYSDPQSADSRVRRAIEVVRIYYRSNDLERRLNLGALQSRALAFETYRLACTPRLLERVFVGPGKIRPADVPVLMGEGGYLDLDGNGRWWIPSGRVFYSEDPADDSAAELASAREHFFLPRRYRNPFGSDAVVRYDAHDLLIASTRDSLDNVVTARNHYRMLAPDLVTDPNGNRSAVRCDPLGQVVSTFVMGKAGGSDGDRFDESSYEISDQDDPTTRLEYNLFVTMSDPEQPVFVHTFARERHGAANPRWQESRSYSDGFGREIQKRIQAEAGPLEEGGPDVDPRWVCSGWTVFNNKGQPVRQYEPFFTGSHEFSFGAKAGVSSVLFYDPVGRAIGSLRPDHSWSKTRFDAWSQEAWDANDTALVADPSLDRELGGMFHRLPHAEYMPTWVGLRGSGDEAAHKTAVHADTPAVSHMDALGRTFVSVAHNRFRPHDRPSDPPMDKFYRSSIIFDIEGNQCDVVDAQGRVVMRYEYDMLGTRIHQSSMEAGERWTVADAAGGSLRAWDSRGHIVRHEYDPLRRRTNLFVAASSGAEILVEKIVYGEAQGDAHSHRGRVYQHFDGAGIVTNVAYDFKGNLTHTRRQLTTEYRRQVDWLAPPAAAEEFESTSTFDALNRPIEVTAPDKSVIVPGYNEANLLERLEVRLQGAGPATSFIEDIDYNAKGQQTLVVYRNGVRSEYTYDEFTFRLTRLETLRGSERLQDLSYTYDPVGNITSIRDAAQQEVYFNNHRVTADAGYTYDAIYRLIEATGREHLGQLADSTLVPVPTNHTDAPRVRLSHPGDGQAMGRYIQQYVYDEVGNVMAMIHRGSDPSHPGWTRTYDYKEPSLLEDGKTSNRLTRTSIGAVHEDYRYQGSEGVHGNITGMTPLPVMRWDYRDQLSASSAQAVSSGVPETTYYVYDAGGQRVRKVTERSAAPGSEPTRMKERIYLGGYEVYREFEADGEIVTLERQTLHVGAGDRRVALVDTKTIDTAATSVIDTTPMMRYQLQDHLGSIVGELDHNGAVISQQEYYPYGSTSYQAVRGNVDVSPSRYGYTGQERDEESGLCYHGARYYAPWLARWTTSDRAGLIDGANTYWYARCNPAGFTDKNGKQSGGRAGTISTVGEALEDKTPPVCKKPMNECIQQLPESHAFRQRVYEKRGAAMGASEPTFPETFADEFPSGLDRPAGLKWGTTFTTSQLAREQLDFGAGLIVNLTMASAASTGNVRLDMLKLTLGMEIGGIAQTARHGSDPANWDSGELASDALFIYGLVPGRPPAPKGSGPAPLLTVKRSPRSVVQASTGKRLDASKVMGEAYGVERARARTISGRSEDVWMHNKGRGLGGTETRENLFAGSWGANTIQKHFEDVVSPRWLKARGIAEPGVFETEVLTFVRPGTDVGEITLERIWLDDELILDGFVKSTEPPLRGADVDFWRIPAKTKKN